jgi:uncharacterized integral membrane protein
MRLFKLIVTLAILGLIGLFIYQNMPTWTQPVSFKLNLYFNEHHDSASIQLYPVILLSALIGLIIGFSLLLKPHFKTRRNLKIERQEKKQLQEQLTMSRTGAESHNEAAAPPTKPEPASEKEE